MSQQTTTIPQQPTLPNCLFNFGHKETLMSADEVVCFAPVSTHSYVRSRCVHIATKEEKLFNRCFGWDFYCDLLADKKKYTCIETEATDEVTYYVPFCEGQKYDSGTFVLYDGNVYEVLTETNGDEYPSISEKLFRLCPKFKNPVNEYLWHRYLKKLLAFSITHTSVMYRLVQDTGKGIVKKYDEGSSKPVELKELMALKDEYLGDIDDIVYNMEAHIKRYPDCYPRYKPFETKCGKGKKCFPKKKHYGFNTNKRW